MTTNLIQETTRFDLLDTPMATMVEVDRREMISVSNSGNISAAYNNVLLDYLNNANPSRLTLGDLCQRLGSLAGLEQIEIVDMMATRGIVKVSEEQPCSEILAVVDSLEIGQKYTFCHVESSTNIIQHFNCTVTNVELITYAQFNQAARVTYKGKGCRKENQLILKMDDRYSSRALALKGWKADETKQIIANKKLSYSNGVTVTRMDSLKAKNFSILAIVLKSESVFHLGC